MRASLHRAVLALALVAAATTAAHAAPWSFELPAGYTEQPGAGEADLERLRKVPRTVSVDAQVYLSPDGNVRLTRMTWLSKFDVAPTRGGLESLDKGVASGGGKHGTIVTESRQLVGDQLVGEQVIDVGALRVDMRRIFAADTEHVVHMFTVVCAGPAAQLAGCERAQQSMQLVLPNQASLSGEQAARGSSHRGKSTAYLVGQMVGGLLVAAVALWLVFRASKRKR